MAIVDEIDAILPQTQCGECGYSGCRPYAMALAQGIAPIDRCPPGGVKTLQGIATLLNADATPYLDAMQQNWRMPAVANIREAECIGCTKCIQACPVDAIIGTAKHMHTILAVECTGCGLCVAPCPVDCIEMQPLPQIEYDKTLARQRHHQRQIRLLREAQEKEGLYQEKRRMTAQSEDKQQEKQAKQDYILRAMARVKEKRAHE
jgi:electron transport complex protein RnfB